MPLLLETSAQAQVLVPLVASHAFGLFTAAAMVLVLVPALYTMREAAGAYVGFVVWFNTLGGFAYVAAGIGLWRLRPWAAWLAAAIALATLLVLAAFAVHIALGGAYEMRTVGAMTLRSLVWLAIAVLALRMVSDAASPGAA